MLKLAYKVGAAVVQWLARLSGTQEIRGSSPGRGITELFSSIFICLYIYIISLLYNFSDVLVSEMILGQNIYWSLYIFNLIYYFQA